MEQNELPMKKSITKYGTGTNFQKEVVIENHWGDTSNNSERLFFHDEKRILIWTIVFEK